MSQALITMASFSISWPMTPLLSFDLSDPAVSDEEHPRSLDDTIYVTNLPYTEQSVELRSISELLSDKLFALMNSST